MALRIQTRLGVLPESERAPDSPDAIRVVEPTVGSRARTKGQLYLLVTSMSAGPRAREATRLVADAIEAEYYYDESAGIRVCIVKSIVAANRKVAHARDRLGLVGPGTIGVAIAVVRDTELYVCTVGPAEAYLNRGARLSTLPDPHRDRGLPADDLEPDVWRGEISVGDELLLASPGLLAATPVEELKDALVTLHPQTAIEHLQARFRAAGGTGSDGALIIEAAEVAASRAGRAPVPVRPREPLAGAPDRSPIPLADSVVGGVAAAQSGARRARSVAGGVVGRVLQRVQEAAPRRRSVVRTVTGASTRREGQRRAAMAVLAFVVVAGGLGLGVYVLAGNKPTGQVIGSASVGQQALEDARSALARVAGPGVDLVVNDPKTAEKLLKAALGNLDVAAAAGIPPSTLGPLRMQAIAALDRLYRVVDVVALSLFSFPADPPVDLRAVVRGPDGAPYILDASTASVYRIDLVNGLAVPIFKEGQKAAGATRGTPKLLAVGGRDLLILDSNNIVWRWRAADALGKGTTTRVKVFGAAEWGDDILSIGTFLRKTDAGLYNLYVIDPSAQQILAYAPAADGSGFPAPPSNRLAAARPVDQMTSLYIDGDIWVTEAGALVRFVAGKSDGWTAVLPADTLLRPVPAFTLVTSGSPRHEGAVYGYDPASQRVIAFSKATGAFEAQYRIKGGGTDWAAIRSWYVEPGLADGPDSIIWIDAAGLHSAILEASTIAVESPGPSGAPSGSAGPPGVPSGSAGPSVAP